MQAEVVRAKELLQKKEEKKNKPRGLARAASGSGDKKGGYGKDSRGNDVSRSLFNGIID